MQPRLQALSAARDLCGTGDGRITNISSRAIPMATPTVWLRKKMNRSDQVTNRSRHARRCGRTSQYTERRYNQRFIPRCRATDGERPPRQKFLSKREKKNKKAESGSKAPIPTIYQVRTGPPGIGRTGLIGSATQQMESSNSQ
jgi:hypothetical protein